MFFYCFLFTVYVTHCFMKMIAKNCKHCKYIFCTWMLVPKHLITFTFVSCIYAYVSCVYVWIICDHHCYWCIRMDSNINTSVNSAAGPLGSYPRDRLEGMGLWRGGWLYWPNHAKLKLHIVPSHISQPQNKQKTANGTYNVAGLFIENHL